MDLLIVWPFFQTGEDLRAEEKKVSSESSGSITPTGTALYSNDVEILTYPDQLILITTFLMSKQGKRWDEDRFQYMNSQLKAALKTQSPEAGSEFI